MVATLIIAAILVFVYYVYYKLADIHSYWKKKGVVGPKPHPLYGNIQSVLGTAEENLITLTDRLYNEYSKEKVVGIYQGTQATLILRDPELVKTVLIRDFPNFVNRGFRVGNEAINRHLFNLDGDEWKTLRQKLTPVFSTGKLKAMMPLLNNCVKQYTDYLDKTIKKDGMREVRSLKMKYTMKTITSIAFGLEVNTFGEELTEFESMAGNLMKPTTLQKLVLLLHNVWPDLVTFLRLPTINPVIVKFFMQLVGEIVSSREGKPKVRNDFMDLMVEMKEQGKLTRTKEDGVVEMEMSHELITAQAIVFYVAGFETSSGAMSFLLYELAKNPEIQTKCLEEVDKVMEKYNGTLDYDALKELEYVSMAFDEALRMYPLAGVLKRQALADYKFKDINLTIEKGVRVFLPIYSIQRDPQYYPNPEQFDPERFSAKNKDSLRGVYMPFGDGPRNCIGLRFAKVQSLLSIAHFLHKFRVSPSDRTPQKIQFDPLQMTLGNADGIWLNVERRR